MLSRVVAILLICFGAGQPLNAQEWFLNILHNETVTVNSTITYSMVLENQTGLILSPVFVTNVFPTSLQFVGATPSNAITVAVAPGRVRFTIDEGLDFNETFAFTLTLRATQVGTVTNVVTAISRPTVEDIVLEAVTVVSAPVARSDLTVAIAVSTNSVFVNDWVPYTVTVNRSGDPISGVFLTNVLPAGAILQGYSPSNGVTVNGGRVIFNLGTVSLQSTQVNLTIQPTTLINVFTATVGSPAGSETNSMNNSATNTLPVSQPVLGDLMAEPVSDQVFNPQNALFEQLIRVTYTGTSSVPSARVILSNFNHKVVNAVGTNDGNPFVVHAGPLQTNQSVEILLEYFFLDRTEKPDPDLITYSAGAINLAPPTSGTNVAMSTIRRFTLPPDDFYVADRILLQFPANPGATYLITYSSNMTGAVKAQPPIVAQANYVQWIDYGPPKTLSRPFFGELYATNDMVVTNMVGTNVVVTNIVVVTTNMSMRFYQAIQLP